MDFSKLGSAPKRKPQRVDDGNDNSWKGPGSTKKLPHFDMFRTIVNPDPTKEDISEEQQIINYLGIVYNLNGFHLKTPATIYVGYEREDLKLVEAFRENILATCPNASVIHIEEPNILHWAKGKAEYACLFQIHSPTRKDLNQEAVFNKNWDSNA